jgi:hypothetical protein
MYKKILIAFLIVPMLGCSQANNGIGVFVDCRLRLTHMLEAEQISFKNAVFWVENSFYEGRMVQSEFDLKIESAKYIIRRLQDSNHLSYAGKDYDKISTYSAIFTFMTDTLEYVSSESLLMKFYPFTYDFNDIFGAKEWSNTFVTKLLATHSGNCHSLPYLYKILCDELNVPCHLALAPNHLYIKHRAEKGGWYNTELTSASFPIDAWLMASGYISLEAVQNGIYLDSLSEKECIALCVLDLAQGFNHKFPENDGEFVSECCDLTLAYFPDCVNALLLKAETRLKQLQYVQKERRFDYLKQVTEISIGKAKWDEMNALYSKIYQLGYRQMPEQMYIEWLTSLKKEKVKYSNMNAPGAVKN